MQRLLILALLLLLAVAPLPGAPLPGAPLHGASAHAADDNMRDGLLNDHTKDGKYPELTRSIATRNYHLVLEHPMVAHNLRALTGPYYDRITNLKLTNPVVYPGGWELVLVGYSTAADHRSEETRETLMIVVDWRDARVEAALRMPKETLVFGGTPRLFEMSRPLVQFVREKVVRDAAFGGDDGDGPHEDWIRILDYRDSDPRIWPRVPWNGQKP